jgi:hypothetical protein
LYSFVDELIRFRSQSTQTDEPAVARRMRVQMLSRPAAPGLDQTLRPNLDQRHYERNFSSLPSIHADPSSEA